MSETLSQSRYLEGSTNWQLCVLCQKDLSGKETLILHPRSNTYGHLLQTIGERARFQDDEYVKMNGRLKGQTKETLMANHAVWHRSCYSNSTNNDQIQRAKKRHQANLLVENYLEENGGQKRIRTDMDEPSVSGSTTPFTRSAAVPLDKKLCFFCQKNIEEYLYAVRTENIGRALRDAVEISHDPVLRTRLNTSISPSDAHAIDVRYHKSCWTKHVFHVLRAKWNKGKVERGHPMQISSLIELTNLIDLQTQNKAYLSIQDIETTYINMLGGTDNLDVHFPAYSRKWLKDMILLELPHLTFVRQKDRRKPYILYSPDACKEDIFHSVLNADGVDDMNIIYKAAKLLRRSIEDFHKNDMPSDSIQVTSSKDDVPPEVYTMIRWVMVGPVEDLETENRTNIIDRGVLTLSQNLMYGFKSRRQVNYKSNTNSSKFRPQQSRENPQTLGLALTLHHETRNKKLIQSLSGMGYCVSYSRVMHLETALANAVLENTKKFQGLYVPPFLKKGSFVFFAADNTDFAEDSADGKRTTHGTVIAVYQKANSLGEPIAQPMNLTDAKSLSVNPFHVPMIHCIKPQLKLTKRMERFTPNKDGISLSYQLTQLGWVLSTAIARKRESEFSCIPGWAAYNSLLSFPQPLTQVGVLPLLPELAYEWSTLMTVISQTTKLKNLAVGTNHPTVISFDMALYEKVIQLLDSRPELKRSVVPRLGELHTVMAALRALGASIENSGIDDAWIEAELYGPATIRQILKCSHYKRTIRAHIYSYIALYELALELFFEEHPHLESICSEATQEIEKVFSKAGNNTKAEHVKEVNMNFLQVISTADVVNKFKIWEIQHSNNAMFRSLMNYLHRVETILYFVAASRNANFELHLEAGEALSKLFFSMDRIKYKRLWPRYISDMHDLRKNHPATYRELQEGNISVTKSNIPEIVLLVSLYQLVLIMHVNRRTS